MKKVFSYVILDAGDKMKKKLLLIVTLLFILTGCSSTDTNITMLTCRGMFDIDEYTSFATEHIMYAEGDEVHMITSTEIVRSTQEELLTDYRERLNEARDIFNRLPFYTFNVFEEEDVITTVRMINYKRINKEDLLLVDDSIERLIRDGRVSLSLTREFYESNGAICE